MTRQTADEPWYREISLSPEELIARSDPTELSAHFRALQSVTATVLAHLTLPELLRELLARLRAVLEVDAATVLLCTEGGRSLVVRASQGLEEEADRAVEIPMGRGIAGAVAARRRAVIVDEVSRAEALSPLVRRLASMMVAPLLVEGSLLGVLHVGTLRPRLFGDLDLLLLQVVADRVALAIKNALLYDRAQEEIRVRIEAEAELRERQELHHLLAETATDAIITMDEESVIVSANPAAAEVFGYPVDELVGMSITKLMPERYRASHRAGVRRYLETGKKNIPWRGVELPGLHRGGREILLEVAFADRVREGRRYFTGTMRDITERKATERLLEAQHAVTRVLAGAERVEEAIPRVLQAIGEALGWDVGIFWTWDDEAEVLRVLDAWTGPALSGQAVGGLAHDRTFASGVGLPGRVKASGRPAWIPDVVREEGFPRLAAAEEAGVHGAFGFPVCVGGDCVGVAEFFTREVLDPDPSILGAMEALGSDIGQFIRRKEAEGRLQEREEIQSFLARSSIALAASALDYEGTVRRMAEQAVPALADWCAVSLPGGGGEGERVVVTHADPAKASLADDLSRLRLDPDGSGPTRRVMRTGRSELLAEVPEGLVESLARDPEHQRILRALGMDSVMVVALTARGRTLGALLLVAAESGRRYDPGDLEVAEEFARRAALSVDNARLFRDAQEANRAKSEFMAVMSHELRTPLNAVIGYADLLKMGVADGQETAEEYADRIGISARHLTGLIEEILTFSRLEAGRDPVSTAPVRLEQIVEEIEVVAEPLARDKGIELVTRQPDEPIRMVSDPGKVRQIVLNLVTNAVKFTEEGSVELAIGREDEWVVIRVKDTGIGIAPEHQERVFEPFWQVEQGTTRRVGGTGLGLSVTRQLVKLLGGEMHLRSAPGQGSTFTVRLPLGPGTAPLPAANGADGSRDAR